MNRRALPVIAVALVVGAGVDLLVGGVRFPGYNALLGLVSTIALVLVPKWLGRVLLDRADTDQPDDRIPEVQPDVIGDPSHPDALPTREADAANGGVRDG